MQYFPRKLLTYECINPNPCYLSYINFAFEDALYSWRFYDKHKLNAVAVNILYSSVFASLVKLVYTDTRLSILQ